MLAPASKRAGDKGAPDASLERNVCLRLTWQAAPEKVLALQSHCASRTSTFW